MTRGPSRPTLDRVDRALAQALAAVILRELREEGLIPDVPRPLKGDSQ